MAIHNRLYKIISTLFFNKKKLAERNFYGSRIFSGYAEEECQAFEGYQPSGNDESYPIILWHFYWFDILLSLEENILPLCFSLTIPLRRMMRLKTYLFRKIMLHFLSISTLVRLSIVATSTFVDLLLVDPWILDLLFFFLP